MHASTRTPTLQAVVVEAAATRRGAVTRAAEPRVRQPPEQEARLTARHAHHGGGEAGAGVGIVGCG